MLGVWLKRRSDEKAAEVVIDAIMKSFANAQAEINYAEASLQPHERRQAALRVAATVIDCDRTEAAVAKRQEHAEFLRGRPGKLQFALGISLGCRLVAVGVLLKALEDGQHKLDAQLASATLEGLLLGFCKRYGVPSWQEGYAFESSFETWRNVYLEQERRDDQLVD